MKAMVTEGKIDGGVVAVLENNYESCYTLAQSPDSTINL